MRARYDAEEQKAASAELSAVSMLSFFDQESRPVFVLDIRQEISSDHVPCPVFQNTFMRVSSLWERLVCSSVNGPAENEPAYQFVDWARSPSDHSKESAEFVKHQDIHWTKTTVLERWRVISGTFCSNIASCIRAGSEQNRLTEALKQAEKSLLKSVMDNGYRDLGMRQDTNTDSNGQKAHLADRDYAKGSPNVHFLRWNANETKPVETATDLTWFDQFDWDATALGPRRNWDPELKRICKLLEADPWPAAVFWGKDRITLYNENYRWTVGRKHPRAMGVPFNQAWEEIADSFDSIFEKAEKTGKAVSLDDTEFFLERYGFLEQTYFSFSLIPLSNDDDETIGYYNPTRETTKQKLLYRRMSLLLSLSQSLSSASLPEFWPQVMRGLEPGAYDVPFLLIYSENNPQAPMISKGGHIVRKWKLEGTLGYPNDLAKLPKCIDFDNPDGDLRRFVAQVQHATEPVILPMTDGIIPARMSTTSHDRSFGESCTKAVFCPIKPSNITSTTPMAFIIIGLNPRRPYDADYQLFVELLTRQLESSMAAMLLFAETVHEGRQEALRLSRQLDIETKRATYSEERFQRMADLAPVAMFKFSATGGLEYGNEDYYHLTETNRDGDSNLFANYGNVHEDDIPMAMRAWETITTSKQTISYEVRLKKKWKSPEGEESSTWVVASAYPEIDESGEVTSILGCLTDISQQKWAENNQARQTKEAIELKQQQELFIDMTSHEMRNPLSAIVQCADGILSSLEQPSSSSSKQICFETSDIMGAIDAAQTIIFCAQHQKRISDDVLMFSKLNSDMVAITPVNVRPSELITNGLRVFERELRKSDINLSIEPQDSYQRMNVDQVRLDPSRMLQVLINLVSNAIKFTEPRPKRDIVVRYGASETPDFEELSAVRFLPRDTKTGSQNNLNDASWGNGEHLYLSIAVQDTGGGLDETELRSLFQRFSQASPKTHIQYGGSGLGLFISRKLSESQGGAIGVASEPGKGSTFAFYIKVRRSPASSTPPPIVTPIPSTRTITSPGPALRVDVSVDASPHAKSPQRQGRSHSNSSAYLSPRKHYQPLFPAPADSRTATETPSQAGSGTSSSSWSCHVLIVEDNLINQKVLARQLRSQGFTVAVANHGVEALDHLAKTVWWGSGKFGDPAVAAAAASSPSSVPSSSSPPLLSVRPQVERASSYRSVESVESDHLGLTGARSVASSGTPPTSPGQSARPPSSERVASGGPGGYGAAPPAPLALDVVLMDLEMPIMDGLTCARRIRDLQAQGVLAGHVPVVAVTANARPEQIARAMDSGMDGVVCKPFRIHELVDELRGLLERLGGGGGDDDTR